MQVVTDLGLVITLYDITQIEGGYIYPSDGAAHYDVRFKLVVFRPFPGEVIEGNLASCDKCAPPHQLYPLLPSRVLMHDLRLHAALPLDGVLCCIRATRA